MALIRSVAYRRASSPPMITCSEKKSRSHSIPAFTIKIPRPSVRMMSGERTNLKKGRMKTLMAANTSVTPMRPGSPPAIEKPATYSAARNSARKFEKKEKTIREKKRMGILILPRLKRQGGKEALPSHLFRFRYAHKVEDGGRHVGQGADRDLFVLFRFFRIARSRILLGNKVDRHGIRVVLRLGGAGQRIEHPLHVAVVGGDEKDPVRGEDRLYDPADVLIHDLHRLLRRFEVAGVGDDVGIGEIHEDKIVAALFDRLEHAVGDLARHHLGMFVVVRHVLRGNKHAVLVLERLVLVAVEEVRDVSVLFRLRDAKLDLAGVRERLAERFFHAFRREGDRVLEPFLVKRHGGDVEVLARLDGERVESRLEEWLRDLAHAVLAEVEEDDGVGQGALVGGADRRFDALCRIALAQKHAVGSFRAVEVAIAVHRVVAAGDACDERPGSVELREELAYRFRRAVLAVDKKLECHVRNTLPFGKLEKRLKVAKRSVHIPQREESHEVEPRIHRLRVVHGAQERLVLEERAIADGDRDARGMLVEHPAGAQREGAHLAVALLFPGEADGDAGGLEGAGRELAPQGLNILGLLDKEGVRVVLLADSPAIQHEEYVRSAHTFG